MDERLEAVYSRWCARDALHLWDAPELMRRWLDEGDEALRAPAREAAWASWEEGLYVRRDATWAAAPGAAWAAMREATWAAADPAAEDAGEGARAAVGETEQRIRALLAILPELLRTHGLAARLLDDAREDPWLTREVVRALGLPDLAAWSDWCAELAP